MFRGLKIYGSKRTWVEREETQHADSESKNLWETFHRSTDSQLDEVVDTAVAQRVWPVAKAVLKRRKISDTKRTRVVEEALRHADNTNLISILHHCSDDQLDSVLTEAVTRGLWSCVDKLLSRHPSDERQQWALDQAIQHADKEHITCLLQKHSSKFGTDHLASLFTQAVTKGLWGSLPYLQKVMNFTPEQRNRALSEACKRATGSELSQIVRTFCDSDNLGSVLPDLIRRREWRSLSDGLQEHMPKFTETQKTSIVVEASKYAEETNLTSLLKHCPDGALDTVMKELLRRTLWRDVGNLLDNKAKTIGVDLRKLAVEEATKHARNDVFKSIIRHKTSDQLDLVLTSAIKRCLWGVVGHLLGCGKNTDLCTKKAEVLQWLKTEKFQWAFAETSKRANLDKIVYMLRNNPFDSIHLDLVLTETVRRGMWKAVAEILTRGVCSDVKRKWAVERAAQNTGNASVYDLKPIFRRCADDQLDLVLKAAVKQKIWKTTVILLTRDASKPHRGWVLEEASKDADDNWLFEMIHFCADDQLDSMMTTVVGRKLWRCVTYLMNRDVSSTTKMWTLKEACQNAPENVLIDILHQHTVDECYDSVLVVTLLKRSLFAVVNVLLSHLTDEQPIRSAVKKAAGRLTQDERDTVVATAVRSKAWAIVCLALEQFDVSDGTKTTVINNVCTVGNGVFCALIQHCPSLQLMTVLSEAVKRSLIPTAREVMTRIGQHGDPLAVTDDGRTVLQVVMETRNCRRKLVAECIKLGVSTHQPRITGSAQRSPGVHTNMSLLSTRRGHVYNMYPNTSVSSPLARAVLDNDLKLVVMLWESGSCSSKELHTAVIGSSTDLKTSDARQRRIARYLQTVAYTPRSLKSACRLVISHHLGVGCSRKENVKQLPLPEKLYNYALFADLVDPETGASVKQGLRSGAAVQAGVPSTDDAETSTLSILTLLRLEKPVRIQSLAASSLTSRYVNLDYDTCEGSSSDDDNYCVFEDPYSHSDYNVY